MLRSWVILIGTVVFVCGVVALFGHTPPGFVIAFWGAAIVISILYERFTYKPLEPRAPGPGWTATAERFLDEETGEPVTVWVQSSTGERRYVRGQTCEKIGRL